MRDGLLWIGREHQKFPLQIICFFLEMLSHIEQVGFDDLDTCVANVKWCPVETLACEVVQGSFMVSNRPG